jgi:hypothetical protein
VTSKELQALCQYNLSFIFQLVTRFSHSEKAVFDLRIANQFALQGNNQPFGTAVFNSRKTLKTEG